MPLLELNEVCAVKSFNGFQKVFEFFSQELQCNTRFGIYLPDLKDENEKIPALIYLSGLTCTEANFIEKSGFQRFASKYRMAVINPDTSPRVKIDGDEESYDFGKGAGFYLDATEPKWKANYRMYSYVAKELPTVVAKNFPIDDSKLGIFGHSMGGHGALTIGLKNSDLFKSVSAFAPICNPTHGQWGRKAFTGYLGAENKDEWNQYDATKLAETYKGPNRKILIDQGLADCFYKQGQLLPENFVAVKNPKLEVKFETRDGYDHSYFYIATFIEEHFAFHAKNLGIAI